MKRAAVVLAGTVVGFVGLWVFASPVAGVVADVTGLPRWFTSVGFVTIWFGAYMLIIWRIARQQRAYRVALALGFLIPAVTTGVVFGYSHLHDKTVHDELVVAGAKASDDTAGANQLEQVMPDGQTVPIEPKPVNVEVAHSSFEGIGHHATGEVKVIELADDASRRLTLSDVDIENAPDLHLYMAKDEVKGDVGEYKYIARMKGNKGDQQYKLPDDLDLKKYHVVVVWCRAFDVGVAQAPLKAS